jgi:hypothetical protein
MRQNWMTKALGFSLLLGLLLAASVVVLAFRAARRDAILSACKGRMQQILLATRYYTENHAECLFERQSQPWKETLREYLSDPSRLEPEGQAPAIFYAQSGLKYSDVVVVRVGDKIDPGIRCESKCFFLCCEAQELHVPNLDSGVYDSQAFEDHCRRINAQRDIGSTYLVVGQLGEKPFATTLGRFLQDHLTSVDRAVPATPVAGPPSPGSPPVP